MHAIARSDLDSGDDLLDGASLYCPSCGDGFGPPWERCPEDGSTLVRAGHHADRLIGRLLDRRFRVLRPLAQGAMGTVYTGVQLPIKRAVAIKVIRDDLGYDDAVAQRFLREAHLLTRLSHPNIVDVLDFGETPDGCLYLVMDLLRGKMLDAVLAETGPLSVRRTCEIGLQLCSALVTAHAHGVVHRDLKPANICLLAELGDWVKVLDFGLAKSVFQDPANEITFAGAVIGTPLYMAPETIYAGLAEPRSDLYALGCILYELLTGQPPFTGDSGALVLARHLDDEPPALPDEVPPTLRLLILALLAKTPEHRPANALTVCALLEHCLAAELAADLPTAVEAALLDLDDANPDDPDEKP